jgi:hypothetical protein
MAGLTRHEGVPKSEMQDFEPKTFLISTLHGLDFGNVKIASVPALDAASDSDFPTAFTQKCSECCKICDFSTSLVDSAAKEQKSRYLVELDRIFTKPRFVRLISAKLLQAFLRMCKMNIGRSSPSFKIISSIDCPDNVQDVSWPHVELVYSSMKSLFASKLAGQVNDAGLFAILVANTFSSDERERQAAKDCLSALYRSSAAVRPTLVRHALNQIRSGDVSAELLGFVYDVVSDLRDEKAMLFRTVLRLHNSGQFMRFARGLTQCVTRFVRADKALLGDAVKYVARHWPVTGTIKKQVALVEELESLMQNFAEDAIARDAAVALFAKMRALAVDPAVDVAEAALSFLIGPGNEATLIKYIDVAMSTVHDLNTCRRDHWNVFIRDDARAVLDLLSKASPVLFSKQVDVIKNSRKTQKAEDAKRVGAWQAVFQKAKSRDPQIKVDEMHMRS